MMAHVGKQGRHAIIRRSIRAAFVLISLDLLASCNSATVGNGVDANQVDIMDKVRSIATLKFVGAPDRTIIGLIVQQALSMGLFGYFTGLALVLIFQPYFPRRLVLDPESVGAVFVITVVVCLIASTLGIRLALKIDPAEALSAAG